MYFSGNIYPISKFKEEIIKFNQLESKMIYVIYEALPIYNIEIIGQDIHFKLHLLK